MFDIISVLLASPYIFSVYVDSIVIVCPSLYFPDVGLITFILDNILSYKLIFKIKSENTFKKRDNTREISKIGKEILSKSLLGNKFVIIFPEKLKEGKEKIIKQKEKIKKKQEKFKNEIKKEKNKLKEKVKDEKRKSKGKK